MLLAVEGGRLPVRVVVLRVLMMFVDCFYSLHFLGVVPISTFFLSLVALMMGFYPNPWSETDRLKYDDVIFHGP